ncbi:ornithine carbamoyltransferase [Desulfolutivibrio sulfoxidireducens]|uniref:ornithine carbamoyltransferase n=1 Tax=Desulfolutivibrio sulfoxidireducens TaxID=2773299 RepID=UPI00159E4E71|nr:ornithine carbamoyltransferase [Desulfolutivibrio sulfoxidireducens]QLA16577.1 ornithine carbamoyltransferase [Desulfolutivibrio sulfoxidireducens]QLA19541.1 ornithine carbamoyltransferase [Desulfolutivibrio sulfoxidireducens]
MVTHFLTILDMSCSDAWKVLGRAAEMKATNHRGALLAGKNLALVFEKASTRTRVSFEVAIAHLGGKAIFMTTQDSQLGRDEPVRDTARVLSRYVDGMVVRTFEHEKLEELAARSGVPVINALSDDYHPCQVLSDILTIREHASDLTGVRVAYVGDGNNMAHSWINAAVHFPIELSLVTPKAYAPKAHIMEKAVALGARVLLSHDPASGVAGADYVYTDVWASMGQEAEQDARAKVFFPYQVSEDLLRNAAKGCKVLHCLPAHRGEEITDEVMEGPRSLLWDQAENRLHMQKAILEWVFDSKARTE